MVLFFIIITIFFFLFRKWLWMDAWNSWVDYVRLKEINSFKVHMLSIAPAIINIIITIIISAFHCHFWYICGYYAISRESLSCITHIWSKQSHCHLMILSWRRAIYLILHGLNISNRYSIPKRFHICGELGIRDGEAEADVEVRGIDLNTSNYSASCSVIIS